MAEDHFIALCLNHPHSSVTLFVQTFPRLLDGTPCYVEMLGGEADASLSVFRVPLDVALYAPLPIVFYFTPGELR